jgi:cell division septal protein FtsQ
MFRPIRALLYLVSTVLLLVGIFVIVLGEQKWGAIPIWGVSAFVGYLGRKCPI